MSKRRANTAFTLLELILVLVILAIIVSAVAPSLRSFGVGRSRQDMALLIVQLARHGHDEAVNEGHTYRLNLDPQQRQFSLTAEEAGVFHPIADDSGRTYTLPDGMTMETDVPHQPDGWHIDFRPTGRCDVASIKLTDKLGQEVTISCPSPTENYIVVPTQQGAR